MRERYEPQQIEAAWQRRWQEAGLHRTREDPARPKFYCLDYFPYPSGEGLSVGHAHNYVPTDVLSRFMRMRGYNVLHPMGWDAFGLPAENRAIEEGIHPSVTVRQNTENYRRQLDLLGCSYDWTREIDSSSPGFYRWTQWFFLLLYGRGLAYRAEGEQWWCPRCQTILANEEVHEGRCWRCETAVTKKSLPQWFFRITAYAERLLEGLERVDWPESTIRMQRNWVGKSTGAEVIFAADTGDPIPVFTTRPDTLFGTTFVVLAPEHPLVEKLVAPDRRERVRAYVERARRMAEVERLSAEREKTGEPLGAWCTSALSSERIPLWISDYALLGHGTGAVMGVPAHDQRDFDFARRFGLPMRPVVVPSGWSGGELRGAYEGPGVMQCSAPYDGMASEAAAARITADLASRGAGGPRTTYRMRDWLISRQRYWGAPIPIVYCAGCGEVPVSEERLPVLLPEVQNYKPTGTGRSPLAAVPEFVNTTCPRCDEPARRETDTMGGFACSSWYFLRFADPHNERVAFDRQNVRYWLPVDLYVGGAEHATMHLIYARFWTKVMCDAGLVDFDEPFARLRHQGQILAPGGRRMSKSRKNVITPDEVAARHGADALRAFELFLGPFEQDFAWSERGIGGIARWLQRVWNLALERLEPSMDAAQPEEVERPLRRAVHRTIRRVTEDLEGLRFNTMIAALMEYVNFLHKTYSPRLARTPLWREAVDTLLVLLAPTVPHLAEELWTRRGRPFSVHQQPWPRWSADVVRDERVTVVVQLDGKTRERIVVAAGLGKEALLELALGSERVQAALDGAAVARVVIVPDKLVNIVTEGR